MKIKSNSLQGANRALAIRYFTGKFALLIAFGYAAAYYFKYNANVSLILILVRNNTRFSFDLGLDTKRRLACDSITRSL